MAFSKIVLEKLPFLTLPAAPWDFSWPCLWTQ